MLIDQQEVLRYMRMGGAELDGVLAERLDWVSAQVKKVIRPVYCARLVKVVWSEKVGSFKVGSIQVESQALGRHLMGCNLAFLFCATLGAEVDILLRRLTYTSATDALIAQAYATAAIEAYCDLCMPLLKQELPKDNQCELRTRFSPGYGDWSLEAQRPLLEALDSVRGVGVTLSNSLLMVPSKSVSAVIGVGGVGEDKKCNNHCGRCGKKECPYRTKINR